MTETVKAPAKRTPAAGKAAAPLDEAVKITEETVTGIEAVLTPTPVAPRRIYIAGPMTGIAEYNFPAFDEAAAQLRALGWEVFNPAENDRANGFDAIGLEGHEAAEHGFNLRETLKQDLSWICDHADAMAFLPGWGSSMGARSEAFLAAALGLERGTLDTFLNQ